MSKSIYNILETYWGFSSFRSKQVEVIESVIAQKDTLALLPTGGGKSICFQIPGLYLGGCTIVVSPLIALMKDQVYQLNKKGILADCLTSGLTKRSIDRILDNCIYGNTKFLYVSPERLKSELFIARLPSIKCNLIAVDEAHCISQWGYDFRPSYLNIAEIRAYLPNTPVIALTATATPDIATDIQQKLTFKKENLIQKSFDRPNLAYIVKQEVDKFGRLERLIEKTGGAGIVYVQSRKKTEEYARMLISRGIRTLAYHAGMPTHTRSEVQDKWINNQVKVIVATNAFGMGIDKPDVRWVVHLDIPQNPESYFQEAGRAGRDEQKAYAVLFYTQNNIIELKERVVSQFPSKQIICDVYNAMMNFLHVAKNSGINERFPLDIKRFSESFNFSYAETKSALKILVLEGLIFLPDNSFAQSTVKIRVGRKYFGQTENNDSQLFDMLLRSYSDLFNYPIQIRESEIANRLEWTLSKVISTLINLNKKNVLNYQSVSEQTEVVLLSNRIPVNQINFKKSQYDMLKKRAIERLNSMIEIVQKNDCRSKMLLSYFGEEKLNRCGNCDYCIAYKDELDNGENSMAKLRNKIINELKKKEKTIHQLFNALSGYQDQRIVQALERLEEEKTIAINNEKIFLIK